MRKGQEPEKPIDITISTIYGHETYHDCPRCGRTWQTIPPIPGVIHRTELCDPCKESLGRNLETTTH
jgi:predicted  nucleic acid-binding Zn ribbon protein